MEQEKPRLRAIRGLARSSRDPEDRDIFGGPELVLTPEQQRKRSRVLRRYQRVAHIPHDCDWCQAMIQPGEEYEAEVWLHPGRQRRILVLKEHIHPRCEWPNPIDDYDHEEDSGSLESPKTEAKVA